MRLAFVSPLFLILLVAAAAPAAAARPRIALRVRIDPDRRSAVGRVVLDVENTSASPLDRLLLWRFPARLERRSAALTEIDFYWIYPRQFDAGSMDVSGLTLDGKPVEIRLRDHPLAGPRTLIEIPLPSPLPPGGHARIEAAFATRIPLRYGAFGCYARICTLSGGFYPMPVALDADGYDESAPPARSDIDLTVESDESKDIPEVLIDGRPTRQSHLDNAPFAQVIVGPHFAERAETYRGVRIVYRHLGPGTPSFFEGDRARQVLTDVKSAIELLHDLTLDLPSSTEINLVETALRTELAEPQANVVLVSDQLYRIFPLARFRKFHSFQLVRAVFAMLAERFAAEVESPRDIGFAPDAVASWLVDLFTVREYKKTEFAKDILRWVSFIPTIDRILYAPQIPFANAYFNTLDDPNPTRDDLRRFNNDRPRGKVIYEKLRDLVGDPALARLMRMAWSGAPLRHAAEEVKGEPLDWFFNQWLKPYPEVDYRFEVVRSESIKSGLRYFIRVWKRGPNAPVEPVEVQVTEWGGARHDLKWDGQGAETVLTVDTARSIQLIVLDPRRRLLERIRSENDDLRLDDRRPAKVKLIYNNFGALYNFATHQLDLGLDFSLSRVWDVKNTFRFSVYHNESTDIGGFVSYYRNFGRMMTPSRLTSAVTETVRVARLNSSFARGNEAPQPGTRLSFQLGLGHDDRLFTWEPWHYFSAGMSVNYAVTVLDAGQVFHQVTAAGYLGRLFPIVPGHGLAVELRAAATFGDLKVPSQALFAGGPDALRGYQPDELPGKGYAMVRSEYRHVFAHDLNFNLATLLFIRGIAGAAFVEAAAVAPCDGTINSLHSARDPQHDVAHNVFADAGYSLRLLADWFGVSQSQFNIDIAVPFTRQARSCFASPGDKPPLDPSQRFPIGFYVYFGPVW